MIALIIIGGIILLLLVLLFMPVKIDFAYDDDLVFVIKYFGIKLFDTQREDRPKKQRKKANKPQGTKKAEKKDGFIISAFKQKGLVGGTTYLCSILKLILKKLWWIVKNFNFKKFYIDWTVAGDDAADTALNYGKVCAAVYPVISILQTVIDSKSSQVNINANFDDDKSSFKARVILTTSAVNLIIFIVKAYTEYTALQEKESEKNE